MNEQEQDDDMPRISDDVAKEVYIRNAVGDEFERIAKVMYAHSKYLSQSNALSVVKGLLDKYYIIPKSDSPDRWIDMFMGEMKVEEVFSDNDIPKLKWRDRGSE